LAKSTINNANSTRRLLPLMLDLQSHFLQITALADNKDITEHSLKEIKSLSKHALMTLDYALFAIDALQTEMPFTTLSAAAAAQDVVANLKQLANIYGVEIQLDITKKLDPVYTNQAAIKGALYGLATSLITSHQPTGKKVKLIVAAQETAPNIQRLGIYSPDIQINPSSIKLARSLAGSARAIAPTETFNSGLGLLVSDQLTQALGCGLRRFSHRGQKGIGFYIPQSAQLSLI